jgi:hypothetical protein
MPGPLRQGGAVVLEEDAAVIHHVIAVLAVLGPPVEPGEGPDETVLKSQFENLRFEEDWSALADPEVETDHWLPALKLVELDEGWTLSAGGQIRYRFHSEQNRNLRGTVSGHNDFNLLRTRLHADLAWRDRLRVFVEMLDARIHGNDAPALGIDRQNTDLQNGFVEFAGQDSKLRVGRTEIQYGAQRLISPLDWANTRRTFEGGVARFEHDGATTDVFAVRPVEVEARAWDDPDRSRWFTGVYSVWPIEGPAGFDLYGLGLNESDSLFAPQPGAQPGDLDLYTVGGRYWARPGTTDWEFEAAHQFGDLAGNTINASMLTLRGGVTWQEGPGSPRFGIDLDWASGDDDPDDSRTETFNQLFPLGHAYLGYLDLVGRQNIFAVMPNVTFRLAPGLSFRASYSDFELVSRDDFLYNAGGAPTSPAPGTPGLAGDDVGSEIDLTLSWKPACLTPHGQFLMGWSQFKPGRFVESYGDGDRAELLYLQYTLTF